VVGFFVKAFHGGFVVDEGDDDVAVAADGGLPHHYDVTVVDAGIFHALAPDMESEVVIRATVEIWNGDVLLDLLNSGDGDARCDRAQKGNGKIGNAGEFDGALFQVVLDDVSFVHQLF